MIPTVHAGPTSISEQGFEARYELRRILGEGGMGEVRLCKDARIGREVAVKMIRSGFDTRTDFQARFLREAGFKGVSRTRPSCPSTTSVSAPNALRTSR